MLIIFVSSAASAQSSRSYLSLSINNATKVATAFHRSLPPPTNRLNLLSNWYHETLKIVFYSSPFEEESEFFLITSHMCVFVCVCAKNRKELRSANKSNGIIDSKGNVIIGPFPVNRDLFLQTDSVISMTSVRFNQRKARATYD